MNIVGFGDSFIVSREDNKAYMNLIGKHFNVKPESRGVSGSGPWNMFFDFLEYKNPMDVAIIAWSESTRLYNRNVPNLNSHAARNTTTGPHEKIYAAAEVYFRVLLDFNKKDWELKALMFLFDEHISKQYPNTKFIHLHCFSKNSKIWYKGPGVKPEDIEYHHNFKNGVEIRPSLIYLSRQEDWPEIHAQDKRSNHLTPKYHTLLANAIIDGIENYSCGKIINIESN